MANYRIQPNLLQPWLPKGTEFDLFNDTCFVSLVAFRFWNTKLKGFPIPFHQNFEEINLRFYVKRKEQDIWKRGVVFIKEIVPKPALSFVANAVYKERYVTMPTRSSIITNANTVKAQYSWGKRFSNHLHVTANNQPYPIKPSSEEGFITEHYWGYSKGRQDSTVEYQVEHPTWLGYPVQSFDVQCNFKSLYGDSFELLSQQQPESVILAQGSPVVVFNGKKIIP